MPSERAPPPWQGFARALAEDPAGVTAVLDVARELAIDPRELAWVIELESGWRPDALNKTSGASGLIQWLPPTLEDMKGPSAREVREFSRELQAPLVLQFLAPSVRRMTRPGDTYLAIFNPKRLGKPDETIISPPGGLVWQQNPSLREPGNGPITVGAVRRRGIAPPDGEYAGPPQERVERSPPTIDVPPPARGAPPPGGAPASFPWWLLAVAYYLSTRR